MTVSQVVMAQTEDKKEILILSSFSFYALFSYFWKINCKIPGKKQQTILVILSV